MKPFHCLAGIAVLLLQTPSSAATAPAYETGAATNVVAIPFNPPLGKTLFYRVRKIKGQEGATNEIAMGFTVEFTAVANGYRMTVVHMLPEVIRDAPHPGIALLKRPLVFSVDADGFAHSIEDEENYWSGVADALQSMPGANGDANAQTMLHSLIQQMKSMPQEERIGLIGENILPILDLAATELAAGESIESVEEVEGVFGPITQTTRLVLDRIEGSMAFVSMTTTVPPEQVEAMVEDAVDQYAPDQKQSIEQGTILGLETRNTYEVSLDTGLVTRFRSNQNARAEENGAKIQHVETLELELTP